MAERGWDVWAAPPSAGVVLRAAGAAQEALARARASLAGAAQVGWVSSAATAYGALLEDALADVARATVGVEHARDGVLPHLRAADAARALAAQHGADLRAGVRAMGSGWVGPAPVGSGGGPGLRGAPAGPLGPAVPVGPSPARGEDAR